MFLIFSMKDTDSFPSNFQRLRICCCPVVFFGKIKYNFTPPKGNDYLLKQNLQDMTTIKTFSPREAYAAYIMGSVLVDVRDDRGANTKTVDVKQIVTLPYSELNQRFGEIPVGRPVIVLSRIGIKGKEAAKFLVEHGYKDVATLDGGLTAWENEGLPVRKLA